jgi:aminopeptidase N
VTRLVLDAVDLQIAFGAPRRRRRALAFRSTSGDARDHRSSRRCARAKSWRSPSSTPSSQPRRGLYFIEREPRHVWTQSQDSDARSWFPCFDYPAEKQTTSATIVVPNGQFALGNGALVERTEGPAETVFRYEQRIPHATYLVTMVAGPFSEIAQPHDRACRSGTTRCRAARPTANAPSATRRA